MDPLLLGRDVCLHVLHNLDVQSLLSLGACSKGWQRLTAEEDGVWQELCARDQPHMRRQHRHARGSGGVGGASWAAAYQRAHRLLAMRQVLWEGGVQQQGRRPREREGHAACSWGEGGMLLCGGFGGGILSDLHTLSPTESGGASSGNGRSSGVRWAQPRVDGLSPVPRYGHTMSRCGVGGELAVVFGGLMAGGYQAPLDTIGVLRRRRQPDTDGDEAEAPHGELGTSLGSGGMLRHVLWDHRNMLLGQGMHDDGEETDSGDEEESSSSGEEGSSSSEEEASSSGEDEEEWLPAGASIDSGGGNGVALAGPSSRSDLAAGSSRAEVAGASRGVICAAGASGAGAAAAVAAPGQKATQEEREEEGYEWFYPGVSGEAPGARGYHSAAVSEDGCKVWFFGGIADGGSCNTLAVLDVLTWQFSRPATSGDPPSPRCGHSSCIYRNQLWVVGGGSGQDLLRSGRDLRDVYRLDLDTLEWSKAAVPERHAPLCAGKCHTSVLVGNRLLLFGGSMGTCNELAWLDLDALAWGEPGALTRAGGGNGGGDMLGVLGLPPSERMSATAVLAGGGEEVLVFGGYTFAQREVGDLHRLKLLPDGAEVAKAAAAEAARATAAAAAARGSARGEAGRRRWSSMFLG